MGCCVAAVLLISLVRTAWFKLFPSRAPAELAFAPPARRPAPGAPPPALEPAVPAVQAVRRRPSLGAVLIAGGIAWLVLTEIAAHVLHLVPHSDLLHLPGPVAVALGLGLVLPWPIPDPVTS